MHWFQDCSNAPPFPSLSLFTCSDQCCLPVGSYTLISWGCWPLIVYLTPWFLHVSHHLVIRTFCPLLICVFPNVQLVGQLFNCIPFRVHSRYFVVSTVEWLQAFTGNSHLPSNCLILTAAYLSFLCNFWDEFCMVLLQLGFELEILILLGYSLRKCVAYMPVHPVVISLLLCASFSVRLVW